MIRLRVKLPPSRAALPPSRAALPRTAEALAEAGRRTARLRSSSFGEAVGGVLAMTLLAGIAACNTTPATARVPPAETMKEATPPRSPQKSTGIVECDRYIAIVNSCISTKMPAPDRDTMRLVIDDVRDSQVPELVARRGRKAAIHWCSREIEQEMRNDHYGCYGGSEQVR